jgi:tetratricopeptide (TPR) repeat protein
MREQLVERPAARGSSVIVAAAMAAAFAVALLGLPLLTIGEHTDQEVAGRPAERLIAARRFSEALPLVLDARRRRPDDTAPLRQLARVYAGLGRPADEAATWEQLLTVSAASDDVCLRLSEAYRTLVQPANVISTAERCLAFDSRQPELLGDMAEAYLALGNRQAARDALSKAARIAPSHPRLRALGRAIEDTAR